MQNLEKSSQDGPRWRQDGAKILPRGLPEALRSEKRRKKQQGGITNTKISMSLTLVDRILEAQAPKRGPRPSQERPKRCPERSKSGFQQGPHFSIVFSTFFSRFSGRFLMFFGVILLTFLWECCYHWFMKILIFICFFLQSKLICHFLYRQLSETFF